MDSNNITIIPPGVDTHLFRIGNKTEKPSITYFGDMRHYKRPEHALIALKLLLNCRIDATLFMVGEGPSLPFLRSLARDMHLQNNVSFTGRLSSEDLGRLVSQS